MRVCRSARTRSGPFVLHPLVLLYVLSGSAMISKTLRIPRSALRQRERDDQLGARLVSLAVHAPEVRADPRTPRARRSVLARVTGTSITARVVVCERRTLAPSSASVMIALIKRSSPRT